jgi:triacylglycerol lipase
MQQYRWFYTMILAATLIIGGCTTGINSPTNEAMMETRNRDHVILLHGMGRTAASMRKMARRLRAEGYVVWNESYASTQGEIETLAEEHIAKGLAYCRARDAVKIHFVTHSLGGILVRVYLQKNSIPELGKIVMLAPPNKGSEVADLLKKSKLYRWATGPAGQALGAGDDSLPNRLGPIPGTIGVIAGARTSDPWFSPFIPGKDDGKVSVERTKLNEMADHLVVKRGHTFMMRSKPVLDQVVHFLEHGIFRKF